MTWLTPLRLQGSHCSLEPLSPDHEQALIGAVSDGELWNLWYTAIPAPQAMRAEIERRLDLPRRGSLLPFTTHDAAGRVVGMTTFMNIDAANQRVEIGSTWTAASVQRSGFNTECKLLLLTHAFAEEAIAVEFRTNFFNQQSRRAIERLGAKLDGILRSHQRMPNGLLRDTCVYSITRAEWPAVRAHLQWQLDKPR